MSLSERWLQEQVRILCDDLGLAVQHIERSDLARAWLPGWPDLVIIGTATLYRELKRYGEHPTTAQRKLGYVIQAAGGDWAVWRPGDLTSGLITRELTAISKLGARA